MSRVRIPLSAKRMLLGLVLAGGLPAAAFAQGGAAGGHPMTGHQGTATPTPKAGGASPEAGGAGKLGGHPWVKSLQAALNRREHAHLTVDGIMGPKTRASLKLFQKAHGLKPTGHLDKATEQDLGI